MTELLDADTSWRVASRWEEYEGEGRANVLRSIGVAAFYAVQYWHFRAGGVTPQFHRAMTAVVVAWILVALAVRAALTRRVFPPTLKYFSTAADLALLTCALLLADGPRSPLLPAYFVVLALAGLRFDLGLVRFAAAGALLGYGVLLGNARWMRPELAVPRYQEALFALGLALTGLILGQIVRRVRFLAEDFASRLETP